MGKGGKAEKERVFFMGWIREECLKDGCFIMCLSYRVSWAWGLFRGKNKERIVDKLVDK